MTFQIIRHRLQSLKLRLRCGKLKTGDKNTIHRGFIKIGDRCLPEQIILFATADFRPHDTIGLIIKSDLAQVVKFVNPEQRRVTLC